MMAIAVRESGVLAIGCVVSAIVAYLLNFGQPRLKMMPFANPLAALFIPIIVSLVRAAFVRKPSADVSKLRSILYQVSIALALILLLLFEIGVGLFIGAVGIPIFAWLIVAGFGMLYVLFFCFAEAIDPYQSHDQMQNPLSVAHNTSQNQRVNG